jgi:hypothetical protein
MRGTRRVFRTRAILLCRKPRAPSSMRATFVRSAGVPRTEYEMRAIERSLETSTSVMVTNPERGSETSNSRA